MAKDDYFVLAYRILAYLYACLKAGEQSDLKHICAEELGITPNYWEYIMRHLHQEGFIEGIFVVNVIGRATPQIKLTPATMITPKGIEFLENNSTMAKAKNFLKTLKETIPGL